MSWMVGIFIVWAKKRKEVMVGGEGAVSVE